MITASCPSCGGTLQITAETSKMVTCSYCGMISYINAKNLEMIGQKSLLVDYGSMLKIGKKGKIRDLDFQVIGRLRIDYEDGFWDEWYLQTPQGAKWLSEDEGKFVFFTQSFNLKGPDAFSLSEQKVGNLVKWNYDDQAEQLFISEKLFIIEKSKAKINGGEGELPYCIKPDDKADFIDALCKKQLYSFEFLTDTVELHIGDYIDINEIKVFS